MEQAGIWTDQGYVDLGNPFSDEVWSDLEAEAHALHAGASSSGFTNVASHRDGSFASPSQYRSCEAGPVFRALHRSRDLLETLREATGMPRLIPVRCGYNYYAEGDYLGLHRDSVKATVTINIALTANLVGLSWAPQLRLAPNDALGSLVVESGYFPESLTDMLKMPHRSVLAFDGYNIPHWRRPFEGELGILGNCCYFNL